MARAFAAGDRGRPHRLRGRPDGDARHGAAVDAGRRHAVLRSGRHDMASRATARPRRLLSDRARRRLARAAGAARRSDHPAAPQGCRQRRGAPPDRASAGAVRPARLPAHRQRLLAGGDGRSAPTTSTWARRIWPRPIVGAIKATGVRLGIVHAQPRGARDRAGGQARTTWRSGPIYETKLKAMKWAPQGLERIGDWKRRIGALPLVAIGGITPERAPTACWRPAPTASP